MSPNRPLQVAIVGGGITGLHLAIGLHSRGVSYTIYERTASFREIGAGFGLSPNAERAMLALDPKIHSAFKRVATPNGEDYFQWIDGHMTDELIYRLYLGKDCFPGCRRSEFLEELVKLVPMERVKFNKHAESIVEMSDGRISLGFRDGTTEVADVVVGCDGIHSSIRQLMLGKENPAAYAAYTQKFCFRALIPMDKARDAIGIYKTSTRFMYNGPNAHVITYPVAKGDLLNVLFVISDPNAWETRDGRHTDMGNKEEAIKAFEGWHSSMRAMVDLLPESLDKWAIFDMLDNPATSYSQGVICMAGDAAHAAGPHLGAGAGFGIEDSLVLVRVLAAAHEVTMAGHASGSYRIELLKHALQVYSAVRFERTQWLVKHTRDAVDLFQWKDPEHGSDPEWFAKEITWRFHNIWDHDTGAMIQDALDKFNAKVVSYSTRKIDGPCI